jgi:hypothetical protein
MSGMIAVTQIQQQSYNPALPLAYTVQPQMSSEQQVYTLEGNVPSIPHSQPVSTNIPVLPTTSAQIEIPSLYNDSQIVNETDWKTATTKKRPRNNSGKQMRNLKHTKISNYWLSAPIVTSNR